MTNCEPARVVHYGPSEAAWTPLFPRGTPEAYDDDPLTFDSDAPHGECYRWTDRDLDFALQYNRARCFDPTIGRWLDADPLGYSPGGADRFPYPRPDADQATSPERH